MSDLNHLDSPVIGVDLGGTKVLAGRIENGQVLSSHRELVPKGDNEMEVVQAIMKSIERVLHDDITAIGIGVPSVVDPVKGIVYDVQNIPSWKEVHLKEILQDRYNLPVYLNNDANCFALGERYFGFGKEYDSFVGLIVGTGIAAGVIVNGRLYNGHNCGAGEFGVMPYLDECFEYYSCGQFFENVYGLKGALVYENAMKGDPDAISKFEEMGSHLGHCIKVVLYALDPQLIVLGGSVSSAYPIFKEAMWQSIRTIAYRKIPDRLKIEVSANPDLPVLGAAALCYEASMLSL